MTKVFTNGCFDLIHPGHLEMIRYCASLGDHLLIGIDSDERVKKTKGDNRPINPESVRQKILLNFKWVNDVEIFSNDEELTNLIRSYNPDYMIVGSDWKGKHVIGSEYAKIVGFFERIDEFSTTEIITRITTG